MTRRSLLLFALAGLMTACGTGPTDRDAGPGVQGSHLRFPPQLLEPTVSVLGYAASPAADACPGRERAGGRAPGPAATGRA